jgi:hypothetical protein
MLPSDVFGFSAALFELVAPGRLARLAQYKTSHRGRPPEVPLSDMLAALLFHFLCGAGTAAEHAAQLLGRAFSDSAIAERRSVLPWAMWERLLRDALHPQARRRYEPEAFYRGLRLLALDGTQFSVANTPQAAGQLLKALTRRSQAAFAKITTCVLLEVGLHNPLAAAIGYAGQSEWQLSLALLAQLPKTCLVLGDRLYGCAAFVAQLLDRCDAVGSHFLVRSRTNIQARVLRRFHDGSRLVRLAVRDPVNRRVVGYIEVREIWARVQRKGWRSQPLRLWTSLLDPHRAPADELVALYSQRWEEELYFRQLKLQLRRTALLQSHTVLTAAQEIALLILATALVAKERCRAAAGLVPVLRVSFVKVLELLRPLWLLLAIAGDLLSPALQRQIAERFYNFMLYNLIQERQPRSCARKVRQPIGKWPRLLHTESVTGPITYTVLARRP